MTTDRQTFRETLAGLAEKTKTKIPALNGRLEKACKLVLAGDVELHADGSALVNSLSDPTRAYQLAQGVCQCRDWQQAPEHLCCHRLAAGFLRKVQELLPAPAPTRERAGMRVEAQVVIDGRQVKVALWGPDDVEVQGRLTSLLQQYPAPQPKAQPAASQGQGDTPQCPWHGALKQSKKGKGWYCPRQLDDGSWCKSKGR